MSRKPHLTPEEAIEVRELYAGPGRWTFGSLARSFRVSYEVIRAAINQTGAYSLHQPQGRQPKAIVSPHP